MFTFHIVASSNCRLDDPVMLLRADWSKITVGTAKQIADFIVVRSVYHRAADAWTAKVSHTLDEVKDQDVGFTALKHIIDEAKSSRVKMACTRYSSLLTSDFGESLPEIL